jgi:hypothetical protein
VTRRGLPLTRWASMTDTTVSPPITEVARRITTLRTKAGGVLSHHNTVRVSKG